MGIRAFLRFYRVEIPIALVVIAAMIAIGMGIGSIAAEGTAQAAVGPRPTVELVKVFQCNAGFDDTIMSCGARMESQINGWLQKNQPKIRILKRALTSTDGNFVLMIFYEVPEWRMKLPAEAPPK